MRSFKLRTKGGSFTIFLVILFALAAIATFGYLRRTERLPGYKGELAQEELAQEELLEERVFPEEKDLSIGVVEEKEAPEVKITPIEEPVIEEIAPVVKREIVLIESKGRSYEETAKRGEGITHLARRAVRRYLEENPINFDLTPGQRIFIEDYVQNYIGDRGLYLGEKISISEDLIVQGINSAQELCEVGLRNLENFSNLVWEAGFRL